MPGAKGNSRFSRSEKKQRSGSPRLSNVLKGQNALSRAKAIRRVKYLLFGGGGIPGEVMDLISLFHLSMDELTEAGVSYEMVRAIERRYPLMIH